MRDFSVPGANVAVAATRPPWYGWTVGWHVDGEFASYGSGAEPSLAAARFGAACALAAMAADPVAVRLPVIGRWLVPRETRTLDARTRVIDLERVLVAMLNAHRCEREYSSGPAERWAMRPHLTASGELGSMVALLLDHLSLPLPERGHPANHVLPADDVFTYLASQAVVLTPLATAYLAGLGDAGPRSPDPGRSSRGGHADRPGQPHLRW